MLTAILDTYSKIIQVASYSEKWWNKELAKACKIWAKRKKTWGQTKPDRKKLKQSQNKFYRVVRKAKWECWQNFLESEKEKQNIAKIWPKDKNRCWIALKYTKLKGNTTSYTLSRPNNEVAITIKDKKSLVRVHVFPRPLIFQALEYRPKKRTAHLSIPKNDVAQTLLFQSEKKYQD